MPLNSASAVALRLEPTSLASFSSALIDLILKMTSSSERHTQNHPGDHQNVTEPADLHHPITAGALLGLDSDILSGTRLSVADTYLLLAPY